MTLKRFFTLIAGVVLSSLCLTSCVNTDPEDIDTEDYLFGYSYSYNQYEDSMKPVMEAVAAHYMKALRSMPEYKEISDHTFVLQGVRLYDAYDKVLDVLKAANKTLKENPVPGCESLRYPFSFDVKYTTTTGITALAFSHGFNGRESN